ncbi:MAG TPA: M28 family metallopeptidase [Acidobacteriaceae bacterium]|nr:M28 family metallopeptidase [Acidobacteriaceae bacterium]
MPSRPVPLLKAAALCSVLLLLPQRGLASPQKSSSTPSAVFGYRDFSVQAGIDREFLAVPDPKEAQQDLKTLTAAPHIAGSHEDYETALYVEKKFREAGLDTSIVEYRGWINFPKSVFIQAVKADGTVLMTGPSPERVNGDPYQKDPRILPAFNGSSPSGDVTADVVYANYGRPEDFELLQAMHVDVRGKLVLVRYGRNYRGVKIYDAEKRGAAGVVIFSDPQDDGYFQGDAYPNGPWRPATGVQRGAVQFLFKYPGDATTPGIASTPTLPSSSRIPPSKSVILPTIPSMPLSYHDASPILGNLGGPEAPRTWQGSLPFTYHLGGSGGVKVHMKLQMDYAERPLWDVVGTIKGSQDPNAVVLTGNHRDAWVFGAVDPGSGTVALLEAVRGVGTLLSHGWKPKRTMIFLSWDGEEQGLIGSTEWAEDHAHLLESAVAYFNTDIAVSGPRFQAAAVPSLNQFLRQIVGEVPSPGGGSVLDEWKRDSSLAQATGLPLVDTRTVAHREGEVPIGALGSGSDYTPFLQHFGVPSTDIGSVGPYGVYHSAFDDYKWFTMNADPNFVYEQEMARVFGLEALHMADADVLPLNYADYGKQILSYLEELRTRAKNDGGTLATIDFTSAFLAADRFTAAATLIYQRQLAPQGDLTAVNSALRAVESDFLSPQGLPDRGWYKHTIYAPGEYTGYAAVPLPGVAEAMDNHDATLAQQQLGVLTAALERAAATLEAVK